MSKLDDLVAKIRQDVEIRKRGFGKVSVETSKTREKREARERGDDPAMRALMRASNATVFSAKPDPYKHFHEVGRTSVLQKQICRCCETTQINVVAEMLHLRGIPGDQPGASKADIWIRRSSVANLPHEEPIWAPAHSVEFCADCIVTASALLCWQQPVSIPEASNQLPLIN